MLGGVMSARETMHEVMVYLGEVNSRVDGDVPRVVVGHGMITGATFSSGMTAMGEDFEYSVNDLRQAGADLVAFGHVHRQQSFPGAIFYSGSPGRLNMGETEVKGFLVHEFSGSDLVESRFVETPARRFVLTECGWEEGVEGFDRMVESCEADCSGADVRLRFTVPEENRHMVNRDEVTRRLMEAGARRVVIELTIVPAVRQRAAGISRLSTLADKVAMLGESGFTVTPRVLELAAAIEGRDVEELLDDARRSIRDSLFFGEADAGDSEKAPEGPETHQVGMHTETVAGEGEQLGLF